MRVLIVLVLALIAALTLLLWITHRAPPVPATGEPLSQAPRSETGLEAPKSTQTSSDAALTTPAVAASRTAPETTNGPRCRVLGRLVDEEGTPLAQVSIRMVPVGGRWSDAASIPMVGPEGRKHEELSTTSGGNGRFEMSAPLPSADWITMWIEPDLYHATSTRQFGGAGRQRQARLVQGDNDLGDTVLVACGAVEGRVLASTGQAAAGAVISSDGALRGNTSPTVDADDRGRFVLGHITPGMRTISFGGPDWMVHDGVRVDVTAGVTAQLPDVILSPASTIAGFVVDESGTVLEGVRVSATSEDRTFTSSTRTDQQGAFSIRIGKPGRIALFVPEQKGFQTFGGADDTFEPGASGVRIELRHAPTKRFRVVDAHGGGPIARFGIRVDAKTANRAVTRTESDVPLADHPGGEASVPFSGEAATVTATAPGHAAVEVDVQPDSSKTQTIVLARASSIAGRVMFAGEPAARAAVTLQRDGVDPDPKLSFQPGAVGAGIHYDLGPFAGRLRVLLAEPDGAFAFQDLSHGTYALSVKAYSAANKWLRAVAVPSEQTLQLGDVVLDAGATVRGVFVAGASTSPLGFTVRLDGMDGTDTSIDGVDGKFEFTGLDAGHHTISWSRPTQRTFVDDDPREQPLELAAGETREVILDASGSAPCQVIVHVKRNDAPARGVKIAVRVHTPGKNREVVHRLGVTDENGTAEGEVDGDVHFDLIATRGSSCELGEIADGIDAVPGGRIERNGTLSVGTLVIELPTTLQSAGPGEIGVNLVDAGGKSCYAAARTRGLANGYGGDDVVWDGNRIELGDFAAGSYDATLRFTRYASDAVGPTTIVDESLREPYKTKVTIEAGREAKIVVP